MMIIWVKNTMKVKALFTPVRFRFKTLNFCYGCACRLHYTFKSWARSALNKMVKQRERFGQTAEKRLKSFKSSQLEYNKHIGFTHKL